MKTPEEVAEAMWDPANGDALVQHILGEIVSWGGGSGASAAIVAQVLGFLEQIALDVSDRDGVDADAVRAALEIHRERGRKLSGIARFVRAN